MKKKKRLITQLFPSYLLITLVSLFAVSWYFLSFTRQFYLERTQVDLEINGRLLEKQVARLLSPLQADVIDRLCKDAASKNITRVTVILPDGKVVGDSEEDPANMVSHLDREEISTAFHGSVGMSIRNSETLNLEMMYVAIPIFSGSSLLGVLRTSIPITAIHERLSAIRSRIAVGVLLVALLASGVSWYVSKRITIPIERLKNGAQRFAEGDLKHRLLPHDNYEFSALADSMNQMAQQLQMRLEEIVSQRRKSEAVLASMHEGVIATDMEQRVISINPAAVRMFAVRTETINGKSVLEVIRNLDFQELVTRSLSMGETMETDIVYHIDSERIFNIHCTPLFGQHTKSFGGAYRHQ